MQLESATTPMAAYQAKFEENGGIVEERIVGESCSAQACSFECVLTRASSCCHS